MSLTALAVALSIAAAPLMGAASLAAVQWDKRVLVIFADRASADYGQQRDWLMAETSGLSERDMLVLAVSGTTVDTLSGSAGAFDADALRERLAPGAGAFEVVLVGKDGGVKLRRTAPITTDELFATIDAMPMRASEMARDR